VLQFSQLACGGRGVGDTLEIVRNGGSEMGGIWTCVRDRERKRDWGRGVRVCVCVCVCVCVKVCGRASMCVLRTKWMVSQIREKRERERKRACVV